MRKLFLILLLLCSSSVFSQKVNPWSLELGASTYNYVFDNNLQNNSNNFNYEFYMLPSKSFSWIKLTTGIMYSTKRINRDEVVDYDIKYIKLPILASVGYSFKRVKLSFTGGVIFDHILNYRVKLNYNYDGKNYKDYKFDDVNVAVRGGITISTEIFKKINLTLQPFIDYKIDPDNIYYYSGRWDPIPDYDYYHTQIPNGEDSEGGSPKGGLLSYGLSIGLEYTFK
ncbi:MAG: hypothetical protein H6Q16_1738 [Bacteroidetes bacterium]|nr:hypothetical protein [Bacteroidota bacterium]